MTLSEDLMYFTGLNETIGIHCLVLNKSLVMEAAIFINERQCLNFQFTGL